MPKTYFSNGLTDHGNFRWLMTFCYVTVLMVTTTINGKGELALADVITLAAEIGLSEQYATQTIEELTEKCAARKMVKFRLR